MITYRNTEYYYKEWTTWNGNFAKGYTCNDIDLLKNVNVVSFGTQTEPEMHERIDDYLDNAKKHKELKALNDKACAEFYAKPTNYKGD